MHQIVEFAEQTLGVKLYPGQAEALSAYYESGRPNWLFLAGRRGGKSLVSDIVACYEALIPEFTEILRPGEERYILIVSVRQENAMLHIQNIRRLLKHNKAVGRLIAEQAKDRLKLSNGVTILSLPASARAGRGFTVSTLLLDELAHFVDTQGNQSADAVFDAFSPTLATFGDYGRLIITTTPAARVGIVYDLYDRTSQGAIDDFYITKKTTRELNPRVSERTINRARARDALSAAVEYDAEFSDPVTLFFDTETIDLAIDGSLRKRETAQESVSYIMAIDPATMGDRYAFVIGHESEGKYYLDYAHILTPPVNPAAAEDLLLDLARRFKPQVIRCDTASTVQRLKDKLPALSYTPFTRPLKLRIYGALKEQLNLGNMVLFKHADLIDELKALQIRNGVDIAAPRSGRVKHDDLSDCLALVVDALVESAGGMVTCSPNIFYYYDQEEDSEQARMSEREYKEQLEDILGITQRKLFDQEVQNRELKIKQAFRRSARRHMERQS